MQRGARSGVLDAPLGGPTWPSEGVRNIYKPNGILHILQTKRKTMVSQKRMRKTKKNKIRWKNEYLE